jgi:hypothetical protein
VQHRVPCSSSRCGLSRCSDERSMMADLSRCSAEASRFEALSAPARTGAREHAIASSSKSEHGRAHAPDKMCFRYMFDVTKGWGSLVCAIAVLCDARSKLCPAQRVHNAVRVLDACSKHAILRLDRFRKAKSSHRRRSLGFQVVHFGWRTCRRPQERGELFCLSRDGARTLSSRRQAQHCNLSHRRHGP